MVFSYAWGWLVDGDKPDLGANGTRPCNTCGTLLSLSQVTGLALPLQ